MSNDKVKIFKGDGAFNIRDEMVKDSKDLLDSVEVTNLADECQKLKDTEDMIKSAEVVEEERLVEGGGESIQLDALTARLSKLLA